MQVGDLVKIVQAESDRLMSPFVGQVGVIVKKTLMDPRIYSEQDDWYDVLTRNNIRTFRTDYLERIK
mgnify:CR=1 FL=1